MDSKYFKKSEFACKCGCGFGLKDGDVSQELIDRLDKARAEAGVPFIINSGCRCLKHNKNVGGATNSTHLRGQGVDISISNNGEGQGRGFALKIETTLRKHFVRIGVAKTFIHVDVDHSLAHQGEIQYG